MKRTWLFAVTLAVIGLASRAAHADSIIVTLDTPIVTVHTGETAVDFYATITTDPGNAGPSYFNFDSYTLDSELTLDDTGLFVYFPYPMAPGYSVDTLLFTIYLSGNEPVGPYLGSFTIIGGADGNAQETLGSVNFEIDNVGAGIPSIPEPSTLALCGTGMLCMAGTMRRRWSKA